MSRQALRAILFFSIAGSMLACRPRAGGNQHVIIIYRINSSNERQEMMVNTSGPDPRAENSAGPGQQSEISP